MMSIRMAAPIVPMFKAACGLPPSEVVRTANVPRIEATIPKPAMTSGKIT